MKQQVKIALFGLENQAKPDFQMPLRVYSYNGASYKTQIIHDKKSPNLEPQQGFYPVLTLVLYFGLTRWNTAKTLYEAVKIPDDMKPFIPDLPINLVEVAWLDDEVIDKFQSDFKVVAKFFKQLRLRGDTYIDMQDPTLSQTIIHFIELMRLMSAYSGDSRFEADAQNIPPTKERTMLAVLTRLENNGRNQGMREERLGLTTLFANLFKQGRGSDVQRAVEEPEYLKKIMEEFGMKDDVDIEEAGK